jgi:hypothetical protein
MTVARRERAPSLQGRIHGGSLKQPPHAGLCTTLSLTKNGEQTTSDIQPVNQSKENQKTIASKPKGQSAAVDLMTVARRERAPSLQGRNHGGSLKQPPHTGPCTTLSLTKNGEQTPSDIQPANQSKENQKQ